MRSHAPFEPTDLEICVWDRVTDVINCAKFFENQFNDFGAAGSKNDIFH